MTLWARRGRSPRCTSRRQPAPRSSRRRDRRGSGGAKPGRRERARGSAVAPDCQSAPTKRADGAQNRADLATEKDERDDRDNCDEGEDERVFSEPLAVLVADEVRRDEFIQTSHVVFTSFPTVIPPERYTRSSVR